MNMLKLSAITAAALLASAGAASADLITNGNFSSGNTGFYSNYNYVTTGGPGAGTLYDEGTYAIVNYDTLHPSFGDFLDADNNANGQFMVVNGTTTGNGPSWGQALALNAGSYKLSAFFATVVPPSSLIQFRVLDGSGSLVTQSLTFFTPAAISPTGSQLPNTNLFLGNWVENNFEFTLASTGNYKIEIWDLTQVASGNDYAIDNISLTLVPLPPAALAGLASLAGVGAFGIIRRKRNVQA